MSTVFKGLNYVYLFTTGVFGGSNQIVQLFAAGVLMGVPKVLVDPLAFRSEQRSSISNLYMLPATKFFSPKTEVIARTKDKTYYVEDTDEFLKDIGFPQGVAMRKHIVNSTYLMGTVPGNEKFLFQSNTIIIHNISRQYL